jgi:hypothetical protein
MNKRQTIPLQEYVVIWSLWVFAVSHPLLQKLEGYPQFFVAHRTTTLEAILLVAIAGFMIPLIILLLLRTTAAFSPRTAVWAQRSLLAVLMAITLLPIANHFWASSGVGAISVACLVAICIAVLYHKSVVVRMFHSFLAAIIVISH